MPVPISIASHFLRVLVPALAIMAALASQPAWALSDKEAAAVVDLIEALQDELGDFAYDETLADDWFEQDAESRGLIEAAGFTAMSWRRALDATFRGFLATVPESEIRAAFAETRRRLERTTSLTAQQETQLRRATDEEERRLLKWRAEGAAYANAVRPHVQRLRALIDAVPSGQ